MPATAGQLPTKVEEWVRRQNAAGLYFPSIEATYIAMASALEEAEDTIQRLSETVEELEDFKDRVDDHNEQILGKAYDVVDTCHHSNSTDWITKAMKHVLMRDEFLSEEKRELITNCTTRPERQSINVGTHGHLGLLSKDIVTMVAYNNEINRLDQEISLHLVRQILRDLPELLHVQQSVSQDPSAVTHIRVGIKPKVWAMSADKKWYRGVDNERQNWYGDYRYNNEYDFRKSDFD